MVMGELNGKKNERYEMLVCYNSCCAILRTCDSIFRKKKTYALKISDTGFKIN